MRLSIITDEIGQDIVYALGVCRELGISTVELRAVEGQNLVFHPLARVKEVAARLNDGGFSVCSVASPFLKCHFWGTESRSRVHDAPTELTELDTRERQFDILERSFEVAHALGAPLVRAFSFWRLPDPTGVRDALTETLTEAADRTQRAGLRLALENEYACNIATGAEARTYLDRISAPALGVIWDPGNEAFLNHAPYPDGYLAVRERMLHMHVKDAVEGAFVKMGAGTIDYAGQFRALAADGYEGAVSLETHYILPTGGAEAATRESFAVMRELLTEAGASIS